MVLPLATSAPTDLRAVQNTVTSIQVSWTPSPDAFGYRINYSNGGSSDGVDVSGGSTDNYPLTGLQNGESYTISIVATSELFPSESVEVTIGLGMYTYIIIMSVTPDTNIFSTLNIFRVSCTWSCYCT